MFESGIGMSGHNLSTSKYKKNKNTEAFPILEFMNNKIWNVIMNFLQIKQICVLLYSNLENNPCVCTYTYTCKLGFYYVCLSVKFLTCPTESVILVRPSGFQTIILNGICSSNTQIHNYTKTQKNRLRKQKKCNNNSNYCWAWLFLKPLCPNNQVT